MKPRDHSSTRPLANASGSSDDHAAAAAAESIRREHQRFSVDLEVSVLSEHNLYMGFAENLSVGGLFIATHQLQRVGSKIELSLRMPDSEQVFHLQGQVRWVRLFNELSDTSPGLGVCFTELPPGAEAAIYRFVGQREPLFFDDE